MRASSLRLKLMLASMLATITLQAGAAPATGAFDKSIVWRSYEVDCDPTAMSDRCIFTKMRTAGASDAAIQFAEQLSKQEDPGWAVEFEDKGRIDLVMTYHPFRANANESLVLVNGSPPIVPVGFYNLKPKDQARSDVKKVLRRHPEAFLTGRPAFVRTETLTGGGLRFVFTDSFADCRACEAVGTGAYGHDFDASGAYRGATFLRATAGK